MRVAPYSRMTASFSGVVQSGLPASTVNSRTCEKSNAPRTAAMLRALEEKGMLRRCADSYDRRRVVVHLTELGRQTAEQMHTTLCAHVQRVLEQLGEQDSRELIRLLGRITEIEASA